MEIPQEKLLSLIIAQLHYYNMSTSAQSIVSQASQLRIPIDASLSQESNTLAELTSLGQIARDEEEAFGTDSIDTLQNESSAIMESKGLDLQIDSVKGPPLPAPTYSSPFITQHKAPVNCIAFSPDGKYFCSGADDATVKLYTMDRISDKGNVGDKPVLKTLQDSAGPINDIHFHPNGQVVASASDDGFLKFYDLSKTHAKRSFRFLQDVSPIKTFDFHPSGDFVVVGTNHPNFRIYDIHTLKCFTAPESSQTHTGPITCARYSSMGNMFGTSSMDGTVKIYDTMNCRMITNLSLASPVNSIQFSKNGKYVLTCSRDSIGRLWDISSSKVLVEYNGASQASGLTNLTFSFHEEYVIGGDDNSFGVVIWDAKTGTFLKKMLGHGGKIKRLASNPTRDAFVSVSEDTKVKFWWEID